MGLALGLALVSRAAAPQKPGEAEPETAAPPPAPQPALDWTPRPTAIRLACSRRICVHGQGAEALPHVATALAAGERALDGLAGLGLPPPLSDGGAGGSLAFDLYLGPGAGAAAHPDLLAPGPFHRASAFAVVGVDGGPPCAIESQIARVLAQGTLLGLDAAIQDGVLTLQASYLASLVAPCPALELAAIDAAQRMPERAITDTPRDAFAGTLFFPWHLDVTYGRGAPGSVMNALLAIAVDPRPGGLPGEEDEPDLFDALREVLRPRGQEVGDLLLGHAVARAFAGSRSDEAHLPGSRWLGDFGRVRFEWAIDHRSLPRRLAPRRPIAASGSSYLWLDLAEGARGGVRAIADWETQHVFQWAFVKVDAEGRALAVQTAGGVFGLDRADVTIADLGEAAGLLVVATHIGSDDRSKPYDPDRGEPLEASYELTLHPL